jgi:LysM repeat protein/phage baseplate assembly protein W
MSTAVYVPYSALESAWANFLQVVNFVASYTAPGGTIATGVIVAARDTLKNELDTINGSLMLNALSAELLNLQQGVALPVSIDPDTLIVATTRIASIQNIIGSLTTLIQPSVTQSVNLTHISNGVAGLPDIDLLAFIMKFNAEAVPSGLTVDNFSSTLANSAKEWREYSNALVKAFPYGEGAAIEAFNRQSDIAQRMSQAMSHFGAFSTFQGLQQTWNNMVVYPSIAMTAQLLSSDPASGPLQSLNTLRYIINNTLIQLDTLIASFKEQSLTVVHVVTARQNDSLPDIANRILGNFEQWTQIAKLNNIGPPYNISAGQQLFMPPATGASTETPPNYLLNYLGVDLYYGPLGADMLPWTGDFLTISGYNNLMFALERGILTTIGTLVYHPNYGSRVPPEVGNVETPQTAAHIGAYANSAILYDPRVNSIVAWTVSMQPNNLINYAATIQPNGFNTTSVSLNLVLQP